jgi:hypothetical protein
MEKKFRYLLLLLLVFLAVSCGGEGGVGGLITPIGSATLTWIAPLTNDDGTPIAGLAGFKVHYGTSSHHYTNTINVRNPAATTYKVTGLLAGTYYFVVTAYNTSGVESAPSNEVFKTI